MNGMTSESAGQQDFRTYLRILWRWKLLFLAFVVLIPVGAYLLERGKPKIYQSSTLLDASGSSLAVGSSDLSSVSDNPQAVARLVTTDAVARLAARQLGEPLTDAGSLLGAVTATADSTTGFLTITAQSHDPARSAEIARAFASALGGDQAARANQSIKAQLRVLNAQLAGTRGSDQVARGGLSQQIAQLKALRRSNAVGPRVIDPAVASAAPVGPNTRRAVELAFVIALLLGIGAVLLAENSDRRLRAPEDLERLTETPLLGTVGRGAFAPERYLEPRNVEAFQTVRAGLTYYNVDRPLSSVVIVSPGPKEGKTTVAIGLAIAVARAGGRAILVDADLRRPQVSTRLGIPTVEGLGAVLSRDRELADSLIEYPVDAPAGGRLLVLPAGLPPANPSAVISSPEMRSVLSQLEQQADLVIVDTAATLAVSDSLPLIQAATGIVMIVRMNRSSRSAVRRLQKVITSAHGAVMGVVATGTSSVTYGGEKYYAAQAETGTGRKRRLGRGDRTDPAGPGEPVASPVVSPEPAEPVVSPEPAEPVVSPEPAEPIVALEATEPATPVVSLEATGANGADPSTIQQARNITSSGQPAAPTFRKSMRKRLRKGR
jgi:capsular exopolysaccharide synthesis family protein